MDDEISFFDLEEEVEILDCIFPSAILYEYLTEDIISEEREGIIFDIFLPLFAEISCISCEREALSDMTILETLYGR